MNIVKVILIAIFLTLSSCGPYWYKPMGRIFKQAPKDGTPGYRLGWMHGCESGLATNFGGVFFMTFYKWKKDPDFAFTNIDKVKLQQRYKTELPINWDNDYEVEKNIADYNAIFWRAHQYCRHRVLGSLKLAGFDPSLPGGGERVTLGNHSISDIYSFDNFGDSRFSHW